MVQLWDLSAQTVPDQMHSTAMLQEKLCTSQGYALTV